jgi:hypothetical protein
MRCESAKGKTSRGQRVGRAIDYHLVGAKRKPGALALGAADAAFPCGVPPDLGTTVYPKARNARSSETMVGLLVLAADGHQGRTLAQELLVAGAGPVARPGRLDPIAGTMS